MREEEIIEKLNCLLDTALLLARTSDPFLSVDMERIAAIAADKLKILDSEGWQRREIKRYEMGS